MINYPQLIRHEWFDLGKKMTLPDCMNYNYTRPNWVYMYMYYKKIIFVQWEMTQYEWWILFYLHKIILVHNLAFDNLQNLYFSEYAKVFLTPQDIRYNIIVKSTMHVWIVLLSFKHVACSKILIFLQHPKPMALIQHSRLWSASESQNASFTPIW